jgi:hypothetical protein
LQFLFPYVSLFNSEIQKMEVNGNTLNIIFPEFISFPLFNVCLFFCRRWYFHGGGFLPVIEPKIMETRRLLFDSVTHICKEFKT